LKIGPQDFCSRMRRLRRHLRPLRRCRCCWLLERTQDATPVDHAHHARVSSNEQQLRRCSVAAGVCASAAGVKG